MFILKKEIKIKICLCYSNSLLLAHSFSQHKFILTATKQESTEFHALYYWIKKANSIQNINVKIELFLLKNFLPHVIGLFLWAIININTKASGNTKIGNERIENQPCQMTINPLLRQRTIGVVKRVFNECLFMKFTWKALLYNFTQYILQRLCKFFILYCCTFY